MAAISPMLRHQVTAVKNKAAHTGQEITKAEARQTLDELMGLIQVVNKIEPPKS
jgi:hypothetical protein